MIYKSSHTVCDQSKRNSLLAASSLLHVSFLIFCATALFLYPANLRAQQSFISIAAGGAHSLALTADGVLWAWGDNEYGQLGDGTTTNHLIPYRVGENFSAVAAGGYHTLALKYDGSLWAWGDNFYGQLGDNTTTNKSSPVMIGTDFDSIAAGSGHSLGLEKDGELWAWGDNWWGQVGDDTSVSQRHSPVKVGDGFTAIAAGKEHSLGLKKGGILWAWGSNGGGQLGDGTNICRFAPKQIDSDFDAISAGGEHSLGLKIGGALWAWGRNDSGQLGDNTTIQRLIPAPIDNGFTTIAAGGWHSLGLKNEGQLWAWGENYWGQLGDSAWANRLTPAQVNSEFTAIAAGDGHSLGVKKNGTLWAWGRNEKGQLGNGDMTNQAIPVQVEIEPDAYVYYVPYVPRKEDFALGFGISNADNDSATNVTVEYFRNNGVSLGQDSESIPANAHTSFMSSVTPAESGWARITATQPVYGMALVFGADPDPMFDMDFKAAKAANLTAAHVDTGGGWISKAMLANPNNSQAQVTVTFYPTSGGATQTATLSIPAMGAVQYNLGAAFPSAAGSIKLASNQGLVGFLLYDGRALEGAPNYTGGLSIVQSKLSAQRAATNAPVTTGGGPRNTHIRADNYTYFVPYVPKAEDFALGFGISNVDNASATNVTVEYLNNNGTPLGQDSYSIPANAHYSFMSSVTPAESGWARITATQPLYGMALAFGEKPDPMFDMDFKNAAARNLTAAHVDTGGGWISKAMLANPNSVQADVTITFHPTGGGSTQAAYLPIPATGAIQYNLREAFPSAAGSIKITSNQGLVGFLLYDGRGLSPAQNWTGGLSIVPSY